MKKFISMVMAAAMVVSMVPATAFAATGELIGTTYVEGADTYAEDFGTPAGFIAKNDAAEVQFEIDTVKVNQTVGALEQDVTVELDGAKFAFSNGMALDDDAVSTAWPVEELLLSLLSINGQTGTYGTEDGKHFVTWNGGGKATLGDFDETEVNFTITADAAGAKMLKDAVLAFDLQVVMDGTDVGDKATVSVSGDFAELDDAVFAEVVEDGITATLKKVKEAGEEADSVTLEKDLKVEANIGEFKAGQEVEMVLSDGFEWVSIANSNIYDVKYDDETVTFKVKADCTEIVFDKDAVKVDVVDAKAGDVCEIEIEFDDNVDGACEGEAVVKAIEVIGEEVILSVDEDEDVPVIYSGVNKNNVGITDKSKHLSLEVTLEETVKGTLDVKEALELTLPEGVYVTDVKNIKNKDNNLVVNTDKVADVKDAFKAAYEEAEYEGFTFVRKTFEDTDETGAFELKFQLELIAEPGFVGDVVLGMGEQEVVVATFVSPFVVEASANDMIIDYRNTEVPTDIVVKEAEAGLWKEDVFELEFTVERFNNNAFEGDATYVVNEESEMEIKEYKDGLGFKVDEASDDEAAVVTISDIALYMGRNIAAGAYDLELSTKTMGYNFYTSTLLTKECGAVCGTATHTNTTHAATSVYTVADVKDFDYNADKEVKWAVEPSQLKKVS